MGAKIITGFVVVVAVYWVGYSYGTYKQASETRMSQSTVLTDISLGIKSVNLLDKGEHGRLRNALLQVTEANFHYLESLEKSGKDIVWWKILKPPSDEYQYLMTTIAERNKSDKTRLMQEFQLLQSTDELIK